MTPEPGKLYALTAPGLVPAVSGVALPIGSIVRYSGDQANRGCFLVVVEDVPTEQGQRAIDRETATRERHLSRGGVERESYRYQLLEDRAPLPEVCQLIASHAEHVRTERQRRDQEATDWTERQRLGREFLAAKRPTWAKAAIVAELEEDASDMQTDYFATATRRVVLLAWSRHTRDLFAEMRKAAATFEPTAHLASPTQDDEHREKYSMGAGYYLKASGRYSSGWRVKKTTHVDECSLAQNLEENYRAG